MAINKKLIHFKTRAAFEAQLAGSNILDTSIVFIQDANLIWTHGTYYCLPSDEVIISNGIEPDNNQDLWIDTSDNTTVTFVKEAPIDGNMYVRKNGTWVVTLNEVYVGETEPTNGEVIWINPTDNITKYKYNDTWVELIDLQETVIISLVSNQDEAAIPDPDLLGKVIHITYGDQDKELVWQGEVMKTTVPMGMTYQVVFPSDGRYKCPAQQEYIALAGKTREVKGLYYTEAVTVNVTCDDGTSAEGQQVTINGTVYDVDATGRITVKIPFDVEYTVSVNDKSGYTSPSSVTETANSKSKTISMEYIMIVYGVYIEATDGTLYKSTEWNSAKTANSIVVKQPTTAFRIALTQPSSKMKIHSNTSADLKKYMTAYNEAQAKLDMKSAKNTANIMKLQSGTDYAAGYCNSFIFPDGKTKGVLPALGWLQTAYDNKAAVDACLAACGAAAMPKEYYWSSTFWGVNMYGSACWTLTWSYSGVAGTTLDTGNRVRPFAEYV